MSVEFYRESPGKFDSRTLSRITLNRWTGRMTYHAMYLFTTRLCPRHMIPCMLYDCQRGRCLRAPMYTCVCTHLSTCTYTTICIHVYIYIYIYRERERERYIYIYIERERYRTFINVVLIILIYIYIYITCTYT